MKNLDATHRIHPRILANCQITSMSPLLNIEARCDLPVINLAPGPYGCLFNRFNEIVGNDMTITQFCQCPSVSLRLEADRSSYTQVIFLNVSQRLPILGVPRHSRHVQS